MTTILDLPRDLVKEIISRIPSMSMRAVRLTCKSWNKLSKSRRFSKMHLAKTLANKEEESRMIVMINHELKSLYLLRIVEDINGNLSREPLGELTCLNDLEQVKIFRAYYSEGLLLCILKDYVVVWNPYSGQTRWINPKYPHHKGRGYRYALGYGNKKNKSRRNHKILSLAWYEMYDFDSDSWITLDVTPHWKIHEYRGVSLKGNTYWCATGSNVNSEYYEERDDHIICFDFTNERFGPLMRMPFSAGQDDYVTLSCVREEKLAVLLTHNEINPFDFDVWITTKIEPEKVLWSKFLTRKMSPYCLITFKCAFIDEEKKLVNGFHDSALSIIGEAGYSRGLSFQKHSHCCQCVCPYVPSSVQIKQGKRKQQSNLETPLKKQSAGGKRRFSTMTCN